MLSRILLAMCCAIAVIGDIPALAGTFYNPIGDPALEEKGAEAAARLNDALASIHYMYAASERKDGPLFEKFKKTALDQLSSAYQQFKIVENLAGDKPILLHPRNEAERETIEHFNRVSLSEFKLSLPKTQKDLAHVAVVVTDYFLNRLEGLKMDPKNRDFAPLRDFIRAEIGLQEIGLAASLIWFNTAAIAK